MKKKLFFITNGFPYGKGEKTFVAPELDVLQKKFEIVLISSVYDTDLLDTDYITPLPENLTKYIIKKDRNTITKIIYLIKALFDVSFYNELLEIPKNHIFLLRSIYALIYLGYAKYCEDALEDILRVELSGRTGVGILYNFWCIEPALASCRLKKKYPNIKVVTKMLGFDLYNERRNDGRQCFKSYINKKIDKIYFNADIMQEYHIKNFKKNLNIAGCKTIKMGVKKAPRNPLNDDNNPFRIVSCSNLIPLKRVEIIAEAVMKVQSCRKVEWIHFGDGESIDSVKKIVGAHHNTNINVVLKGYVPSREVMSFYEKIPVDCFITTTSTEGGEPLSLIEALSYGIPIIATDVSDISKTIDGNGILLSADPTIEEVRLAIEKMINYTVEEIELMRESSVRVWARQFNQEKNLAELVDDLLAL